MPGIIDRLRRFQYYLAEPCWKHYTLLLICAVERKNTALSKLKLLTAWKFSPTHDGMNISLL